MNLITFLTRWAMLTFAVFIAAHLGFLGIGYDSFGALVTASLVLGIANVFLKPLLMFISLPLIVLSFGFAILLVNALLFKLAGALVGGFHVASFWSAMGGALIVSLISMLLGPGPRRATVVRTRVHTVKNERPSEPPRNPPPGKGPIIDV